MFTIAKEMSWVWPVTVKYPTDEGHKTGSFKARFRLLTEAELAEAANVADPIKFMMERAVRELFDLQDEAGERLPHSPELLAAVLAVPFIKLGLSFAYIEAATAAPAKN